MGPGLTGKSVTMMIKGTSGLPADLAEDRPAVMAYIFAAKLVQYCMPCFGSGLQCLRSHADKNAEKNAAWASWVAQEH